MNPGNPQPVGPGLVAQRDSVIYCPPMRGDRMANDKTGRREEHWNEKEHDDRVEIVRALDTITNQLQSATTELLSVDEQRTAQENKKNRREWVLIAVTAAVVIASVAQWYI